MIEWEHLHPMRRAVSAAGGKNEKAGAKTMGISHEYHSTSHRARHGGVSGKLRLAGAVLAILVLAYAITAILENGASAKDAQSEPVASGIAQDILAPLPMQGEAADSDSSGDSTAPDGSGDAQAVTLGPLARPGRMRPLRWSRPTTPASSVSPAAGRWT